VSSAAHPGSGTPTGAPPIGVRVNAPRPSGARPDRATGLKPADTAHPSGDNRFQLLDACMKRHRFAPDALIEVLHTAQELFGYLQNDLLHYIAHGLKLPPSRVYGVATFYHYFSFAPNGKHTCVVCLGTACYVKGAEALLESIEKRLGIVAGKTTPDGQVSLTTARCLGACGLAPVVVYDGALAGNQKPEMTREHMKGWLDDGSR
jgi:bidirectional [NiFe] hydrogenase diaphorase subunit